VGWGAVVLYGVLGLLLAASPQSFFRSRDAAQDARMMGGLRHFGVVLLHLAALLAFLKMVGAVRPPD
jgi:hypothetical protein